VPDSAGGDVRFRTPRAFRPDRRVERTRQRLLDAFRDLVLDGGYDRVTVLDVIERAGVGRSTFYEHFENKDDLLALSLRHPFAGIASAVGDDDPGERLTFTLDHMWQQQRLAQTILESTGRGVMSRVLAALVEERFVADRRAERGAPLLPPHVIAACVAEAQMGLIDAWFAGRTDASSHALANALRASSRAVAAALFRDR